MKKNTLLAINVRHTQYNINVLSPMVAGRSVSATKTLCVGIIGTMSPVTAGWSLRAITVSAVLSVSVKGSVRAMKALCVGNVGRVE